MENTFQSSMFVEELNQLLKEQQGRENLEGFNWEEKSHSDLIDHILEKHHSYLNSELPALNQYVTKVSRVHGSNHPELNHVYMLYQQIKIELEQHSLIEETEVFPLIKEYEKNPSIASKERLGKVISELETDHEKVGLLLREIRAVTQDYSLPEDACMTYRMTFSRLEELESDMFDHIHLENNILFPRFLKVVNS